MAKSWEKHEFNKTLPLMMSAHPRTFFGKDSLETRPLKRRIHIDIIAAHPEIKPGKLVRFVGIYCAKNRYINAIRLGMARVDLDGNEVEPIKDHDVSHAAAIMTKRASDLAAMRAISGVAAE